MEPLRIEISVEAPMDLVWWAWTETERITEWFAPAANIVPVEGGAYEFFFDPADHTHMSTIGCVITAIEATERLGFICKGSDRFAQLMNAPVPATSVEVTFKKEKGAPGFRLSTVAGGTATTGMRLGNGILRYGRGPSRA